MFIITGTSCGLISKVELNLVLEARVIYVYRHAPFCILCSRFEKKYICYFMFFFAVFASKRKIDFNVIFFVCSNQTESKANKVRVVIKIKYAYIKMATFAY